MITSPCLGEHPISEMEKLRLEEVRDMSPFLQYQMSWDGGEGLVPTAFSGSIEPIPRPDTNHSCMGLRKLASEPAPALPPGYPMFLAGLAAWLYFSANKFPN